MVRLVRVRVIVRVRVEASECSVFVLSFLLGLVQG